MDRVRFELVWNRCCAPTGVSARTAYQRLRSAYMESHRHYHSIAHIQDCMHSLDTVREALDDPDAVELALYFHDAVYRIGAADNEARSADMAASLLRHGMDDARLERIQTLILDTRHNGAASSVDGQYLADVDLCAFGRPWAQFALDLPLLRAEAPHLSDETFHRGRNGFLRRFIERGYIFQSPLFRQRHEAQARANVLQALDEAELWEAPALKVAKS